MGPAGAAPVSSRDNQLFSGRLLPTTLPGVWVKHPFQVNRRGVENLGICDAPRLQGNRRGSRRKRAPRWLYTTQCRSARRRRHRHDGGQFDIGGRRACRFGFRRDARSRDRRDTYFLARRRRPESHDGQHGTCRDGDAKEIPCSPHWRFTTLRLTAGLCQTRPGAELLGAPCSRSGHERR